MVWPSEIRARLAPLESDRDLVVDRFYRILLRRSGKPARLQREFSGFQLKVIQEAVTLTVFMVFAVTFLKEKVAWNYLVAFFLILLAALFAFGLRSSDSTGRAH